MFFETLVTVAFSTFYPVNMRGNAANAIKSFICEYGLQGFQRAGVQATQNKLILTSFRPVLYLTVRYMQYIRLVPEQALKGRREYAWGSVYGVNR